MSSPSAQKKSYSVSKLKGLPLVGMLLPVLKDPFNFVIELSLRRGDIITFTFMGQKMIQLNHPDLIRYVMIENHKNYRKSITYIRFESALGLGLLTSHGEKWKRDRKKIQPVFSRDRITGYYFDVVCEVSERYKQKWLELTQGGSTEMNISGEMANMTTEIILKMIFGRNIDTETVKSLHQSYDIIIHYLRKKRIFARVDLHKVFCLPSYFEFKKALNYIYALIGRLRADYCSGSQEDRDNMFTLLLDAQKNNPDYFTDNEIRDQCVTMIFGGFETTSIAMQWMWYALDGRPDIREILLQEINRAAPGTAASDGNAITLESLNKMDYLTAFFKETLRFYPPFWVTSREPLENDYLGDFKVEKGTTILLPQYAMHRHPKYWENPDELIPERFLPLNEVNFDEGIYFPFSRGPRGCIGAAFAEMEAKTIMAKLVPIFEVTALNKKDNAFYPSIALKLERPLMARISRRPASQSAI